ncbi:hypothetical protein CASFOL_000451 [Castilleja foliolosa]|uniref:Uncharacterized protein n=1 Tax=Castilleja foliolosa TaxID=1961234 RepID=A0ABD3ENP8_9LAMI
MKTMYYQQLRKNSYEDSLKVLESDIQHANAMVYTDGRPKVSTLARKASVQEFYAIILPSLEQLHSEFVEHDSTNDENILLNGTGKKRLDSERDDECGICLETCTKMVTSNCCRAMCINCYRDLEIGVVSILPWHTKTGQVIKRL